MPFESDILKFKAYTYTSNISPVKPTDQVIILIKKSDGYYGVAENKILIKVHSAALNPIDSSLYNSAHPIFKWIFGEQGVGRDYSGVIADIGDTAAAQTGFKVGDEVAGLYTHPFGKGTVSEYIEVDPQVEKSIVKKPTNLDFNETASFPLVYGTAHSMLSNYDVKDKSILVLGGSTSVGKYLVQLAKLRGAKTIATTNSPKSNELVTSLGSTHQIDYTKSKNLLNPVLEAVKELGEFDYIFDTCGNSDLFAQISTILKPRSTGSAYLTCVGDYKFDYNTINGFQVLCQRLGPSIRTLWGKLGYGIDYSYVLLKPGRGWIEDAKNEFEKSQLSVCIDSVYQWEDFNEAFKKLKSNKANGKIVIVISS